MMIPKSVEEFNQQLYELFSSKSSENQKEKAAIYTRVSKEDSKSKAYSMDIQPDRAEEYALKRGWDIYKVYADPNRSGKSSDRIALQEMLEDIKSGKITVVVVHRLDRLYRNLESLLKFIRIIRRYNVKFVSVTEEIDTNSPWGRLVLYVLGALAEMYIWQTSERTREMKRERVCSGKTNASFCYGYCRGLCEECNDPNGKGYCPNFGCANRKESEKGKILVPHPIDSHAIKMIVYLYGQGWSFRDIADYLNTNDFDLPDGTVVHFRKTGLPGQTKPGEFNRDNIRDIVSTPYYVGMVAHYPTRPLDMEDDPENPYEKTNRQPLKNKREPQYKCEGVHQAIYPLTVWEKNQQLRKSKAGVSSNVENPKREYLLSGGIGKCAVCLEHNGDQVGLRGSTGGSGNMYYRCATMQEKNKKGKRNVSDKLASQTGLHGKALDDSWSKLIESHSSTLRADKLDGQIDELMSRFSIPENWYEKIMTYYLSLNNDEAPFEWQEYNLHQQRDRIKELFLDKVIDRAEFDERDSLIKKELNSLKSTVQFETQEILPFIEDFPALWEKMTTVEKKSILKTMFRGIYFDADGNIAKISSNSPFDDLFGINN